MRMIKDPGDALKEGYDREMGRSVSSPVRTCRYCGAFNKNDPDGEWVMEHEADCDQRFLDWYERTHSTEVPDYDQSEPPDDYDGPDEAQEWHDFDPDA